MQWKQIYFLGLCQNGVIARLCAAHLERSLLTKNLLLSGFASSMMGCAIHGLCELETAGAGSHFYLPRRGGLAVAGSPN